MERQKESCETRRCGFENVTSSLRRRSQVFRVLVSLPYRDTRHETRDTRHIVHAIPYSARSSVVTPPIPYLILSWRFHHVTICNPLPHLNNRPSDHHCSTAPHSVNINPSYVDGPCRLSYSRRRGQFRLRFFLPVHFHRLVY